MLISQRSSGLANSSGSAAGAEIPGGRADRPLGRRRPGCTADRGAPPDLLAHQAASGWPAVGEAGTASTPHQSNSVAQRSAGSTSAWLRAAAPAASGNRIIHGTWTNSPNRAPSHGPTRRCSPSGNPRGEVSVSSVSSAGGQAVEKLQERAQARVQQRHLAGVRLRDAQQFVGIVVGREHSVGHVGRRRAAGGSPSSQ